MNALMKELFTTPIGLLSLGVIVGVVVIGAYLYRYVLRRMDEDEAASRR